MKNHKEQKCSTESQVKHRLLSYKQQGLLGVEWAAIFRLKQTTMVKLITVIWVLIIRLKKSWW